MTLDRITPMLPVKHVPDSIRFYEKLGFVVEAHNEDWAWAMLRCGGCRLMIDRSINVHPDAPRQTVLYLYPDDVVQYHADVRANGIDAPDLQVTFYGMTEFRMADPDGNRLWIGQQPAAPRTMR